jgi:hypothetical protein
MKDYGESVELLRVILRKKGCSATLSTIVPTRIGPCLNTVHSEQRLPDLSRTRVPN